MQVYQTNQPVRRIFGNYRGIFGGYRGIGGYRGMRSVIPGTNQFRNLPTQGLQVVPSDVFLWAAGGSILVSLGLRLLGRRDDSLFIGEWAPTLVSLGVLARMIGR